MKNHAGQEIMISAANPIAAMQIMTTGGTVIPSRLELRGTYAAIDPSLLSPGVYTLMVSSSSVNRQRLIVVQ